MPKVSIIVPVYGVEKYIERCARSLFEQTLDDIEYLFIDDCTPDKSIEILKNVLEEYPHRKNQVIIHRMGKNSGQAAVRKWGILNASGDYIIHCDSDDWVDVTMYEKMYLKAIHEQSDIVSCDYYRSYETHNSYCKQIDMQLMMGPLWNRLVRKSICQRTDIMYPSNNKGEDGALMAQYSYFAAKRSYISEALYYYFDNSESICGINTRESCRSKLHQEVENTKLRIEFLRKNNSELQYEKLIVKWKYIARTNVMPYIQEQEFYDLWLNTFPEIDNFTTLARNLSLKQLVEYFLIKFKLLRLYSCLCK